MWKIIGSVLATLALLASCGDDADEETADVEAFCAEFRTTGGTTGQIEPGFGGATQRSVSEALLFFQQLERSAPDEVEEELTTLIDGLEDLSEAFEEFQGIEGEEAFEAVREAADVDLDELARTAADVQNFAANNCEDVSPADG